MYVDSMGMELLQLRDGRMLEYCISGEPGWDLLVFYLGSPLAVTEFPHVSSAAAARNLRVAICSRPGYGGSTRHRSRTVADVARDTAELADHLNAESFFVAGWSGGGPGALACACLLPDRVRACITLASVGPLDEAGDAWKEWYPPELQDDRRALLTKEPEELVATYEEALRPFRELTVEAMLEFQETNAADRAAIRDMPSAGESLARSFRLATAEVWGCIDDEAAWHKPWGFDLADIRLPVIIRNAIDDRNVPPEQAQWLAVHVPGARLDLVPNSGHGSVAIPFDPVVSALLDAAR
jgi:pimeloyl-ACP methyl ester carboxylesterase